MVADYRVRCPTCGSKTPADVNFCPSCGAGLRSDLLILEDAEWAPDGPAARPPAASTGARTSGTRWVIAGAVVMAVLLIVQLTRHHWKAPSTHPAVSPATTATTTAPRVVTDLPTTTSTTTFVTGATNSVLFAASANVVERLDLDANASRSYDLSGAGQTVVIDGFDAGAAVVGDRVVVQQHGRTVAVPASLSGPVVVLGPSVGFLRSHQLGRVWLITVPATGPVVREVDLSGQTTSAPSALPPDFQPMAAVSGGLLLSSTVGFEVWDPGANRVGFRSAPQAMVVAAEGNQVAWQLSGCFNLCALHLTNLTTGLTTVMYPQPPDVVGNLQPGTFSPDGRFLASTSYGQTGASLAIVDLQTQQAQSVAAVGDGGGTTTPTWSPSGQWIFVASSNGTVFAYQRGMPTAETLRLPPPASGPVTLTTATA